MKQYPNEPKIYLLPNIMTAGNLFCGFAAVSRIIEATLVTRAAALAGDLAPNVGMYYHQALAFILGACVFDLLDGRLARLGGCESAFGREFDSLADVVSFGVAPALLVYQFVLTDFPRVGWLVAFAYLLCGTLRLARFNCMSIAIDEKNCEEKKTGTSSQETSAVQETSATDTQSVSDDDIHCTDFVGFPIPAAAGLIASLTLFMLWMQDSPYNDKIGNWKFSLPVLLIFLSFMMFSHVRYPSFKGLGWRTQRSLPKLFGIVVLIALCATFYQWMPAIAFTVFLIYGFVRPFLSRRLRREIEDEG